MSKTTNFYEVLNVKENVSQDEIKKAYRQLSLQYHPDRNQNSLESTNKFQNINAAYEVIGDEQKRRQYDMQRKHQHSGNFPFPFQHHHQSQHTENSHGPTFFSTGPIDIDPTEIFNFFSNNLFSNSGNRNGGGPPMFSMENLKQKLAKPTPIIINETITLNKAYTGFNMPVEINSPISFSLTLFAFSSNTSIIPTSGLFNSSLSFDSLIRPQASTPLYESKTLQSYTFSRVILISLVSVSLDVITAFIFGGIIPAFSNSLANK